MSSDNPITQVTSTIGDDPRARNRRFKNFKRRLSSCFAGLSCCRRSRNFESDSSISSISQPLSQTIHKLLGAPREELTGRKCLVLDLDETLVHSSFKPVPNADFVIPVEMENETHNVFVLKRPHVDEFLEKIADMFEIVVFTASLAKYADPVLDKLDTKNIVHHRLFREACHYHKGNYVKDLGRLGRELRNVIIIDNSPASYLFHPEHALPISSWLEDPDDTELLDILPILKELQDCEDVVEVLSKY